MPQRSSLLLYAEVVLSFLSKEREALGSETARVHHAARRRGGRVAACGARAAARADAAHRRADDLGCGRSRKVRPVSRRFAQGLQQSGLDRRAQRADRLLAGARAMPTRLRKYAAELVALAPDVILATGSAAVSAVAAGDPHRPDRVRARRRSGRRRLCREPGAAGRQRHRLHHLRIRHRRKMAGAAQRDRAAA